MQILALVLFCITILASVINGVVMFTMAFDEEEWQVAFWQLLAEIYLILIAVALGHFPGLK